MRCQHGARYEGKSDEQLMVEFYGCDNEAFDELWECRWRSKMYGRIARKVPKQDVEDILQSIAHLRAMILIKDPLKFGCSESLKMYCKTTSALGALGKKSF